MKKYIPVFGPQELFDGAPDDAEMAYETANHVRGYYKKCNSLKFFSNSKWVRVLNEKAMIIHAMRRIIRTPVWTAADKKAGRLPQIGSKYMAGSDKREFTCLFHGKGNGAVSIIGFNSDDEVSGYQIQYCYPIETQAEKAQRFESEWVEKAYDDLLSHVGIHSTESQYFVKQNLHRVYNALLSGELKAPESTE